LAHQATGRVVSSVPPREKLEEVLSRVLPRYPKPAPACVPKVYDDGSVDSNAIKSLFKSLNLEGSPGLPFAPLGRTKRDIVDQHGDLLVEAVQQRLRLLASAELSESNWTPLQLWRGGYRDAVRLFIKNEPHTRQKIADGRFRLISSCSIVDELVERILFSAQNELEIEHWENIPSKAGMGLANQEQVDAIFEYTKRCQKGMLRSNDVKGFDWSVQGWQFDFEAEARIKLYGITSDCVLARMMRNCLYTLARCVFVTSSGQCFEQLEPGVMKSGSYLTASMNSRQRAFLAALIGADFAMTMGDDCVEEHVDNAVEKYRGLGFRVVDYSDDQNFEFCSHIFRDGKAIPLNGIKGLFRLLSKEITPEFLEQFKFEFANDPKLKEYLDVVSDVSEDSA
jgi:hypothetical protein